MSNKRIVFDVSTLLAWNRPPVGIVRTQLELLRFLASGDIENPCLYVAFDTSRNSLRIISESDILQIIRRLDTNEKANPKESIVSMRWALSKIKNKITGCLPNRLKQRLRRCRDVYCQEGARIFWIKIIRYALIRIFPRLVNVLPGFSVKTDKYFSAEVPLMVKNARMDTDFLGASDIFISVGLDWDHSNYEYLYWAKKARGFSFVGIFYDAIPIQFPHHVRSDFFPALFFRHYYFLNHLADCVVCISDYSQEQFRVVATACGISKVPNLKTIYLGEKILETRALARSLPEKFVLYVSTIESRKNHITLLRSWKKALIENRDLPDLVFVGMWGWGVDDLREFLTENPDVANRVHILSDVTDDELATIYRLAYLSVFPSYVEGWGLGASESLAYGTPCLISDTAALIEATRGIMPKIPAADEAAWLDAIEFYCNDGLVYQKLKDRITSDFFCKSWGLFSAEFFAYAKAGA